MLDASLAEAAESTVHTPEANRSFADPNHASNALLSESRQRLSALANEPTVELSSDKILAEQFCRVLGLPETEMEQFRAQLASLQDFSGADIVAKRKAVFGEILAPYFGNSSLLELAIDRFQKNQRLCVKTADGSPRHIAHELGRGGYASVYLAVDPSQTLDDRRALKQLRFPVSGSSASDADSWQSESGKMENVAAVERFSREVHFATKAMNSGLGEIIPKHYGAGVCMNIADGDADARHPYLEQEVLRGATMYDLIASEKDGSAVSLPAFFDMAAILSAQFDEINQRAGLVHRDVKPGNIHVGADGRLRILDLGLALETQHISTNQLTRKEVSREGVGLGTPEYTAPEQWLGSKVDPPADRYSLFCTLYKLATGKDAFFGSSAAEVALAHQDPAKKKLAVKTLEQRGVPKDLIALFERGWSIDPKKRPEGSEMIEAFRKHAGIGQGLTLGEFRQGVLEGQIAVPMDPDVVKRVTSGNAPYPHGFTTVAEMTTTLNAYNPERVQSNVRRKTKVLLTGSAALALGIGGVYATFHSPSHSADDSGKPANKKVEIPPVPQAVEKPSVVQESAEVVPKAFTATDFFQPIEEKGVLQKFFLFGKLPVTDFQVHKNGREIHALTFNLTAEQMDSIGYDRSHLDGGRDSAESLPFAIIRNHEGEYFFSFQGGSAVFGNDGSSIFYNDGASMQEKLAGKFSLPEREKVIALKKAEEFMESDKAAEILRSFSDTLDPPVTGHEVEQQNLKALVQVLQSIAKKPKSL